METSTKSLNKEQLKAIKHKTGPLLIIAGAGTGKTTVITERIKYLIEKKLAKPEEILALTFTEKASREMQERIDIALPYGYTDMWVMTFHSFCERVLRQNALQIGLDPSFKLMTTAETVQLIKTNLFKFKLKYFRPLGNPYKFVDGILQHFSRLQDENISQSEYLDWAKKQEGEKWQELAEAYKTYEELKTQNSLMDFGDLITKTIKLFQERPNVLKEYQNKFKYILIDEFQDTNYSQNQLAILLSKHGAQNINIVGDDDQSIYRFRGAAISNIVNFRKNFPNTKIVVLTKNYRSSQEILDSAYQLIQHNNPDRLEVVEKIEKKLIAERKDKGEVNFIHAARAESEAELVAQKIKELSSKYEWKDFAILVRANNHAEPFVRALERLGIPNQFLGPGKLFRQQEIIDLISYLKVLYNFDDSVAAYRIFGLLEFNIDQRDLAKINNYARKYNLSFFEAAEKVNEILVSETTKEKVSKIVNIITKQLGLIKKQSAGQLLYNFLESTQILSTLINPDTAEAQKKALNISKFFEKLKSYEVDHPDADLFNVVDWIDLSMEVGESPMATDTDWSEIDAVNILTVHSAKGLEFPVVFLVNLVKQRFPTIQRREQIPIPNELIKEIMPIGDFHLQEERRLFYVGMTRAKDKLFLTAAKFYGEGKREKKLSPFIIESLDETLKQKNTEIEQLDFVDYKKIQNNKINSLSYSQIQTFEICPMHYKLRYILKIPSVASASQSLGISVHNTLREIYETTKKGQKIDEKFILKILDENWKKEGYESKEHEKEARKKAQVMLINFYENSYDEKKLPEFLEKKFEVEIENPGNKEERLKIFGVMDRVDIGRDGSIEIIDYKTGNNQLDQKGADKDLQLSFYALAASQIFLGDIKLNLYYLESGEKVVTTRTAKQLENIKKKIFEIKKEIEISDFKCSDGPICQNCEYKLFCKADD